MKNLKQLSQMARLSGFKQVYLADNHEFKFVRN